MVLVAAIVTGGASWPAPAFAAWTVRCQTYGYHVDSSRHLTLLVDDCGVTARPEYEVTGKLYQPDESLLKSWSASGLPLLTLVNETLTVPVSGTYHLIVHDTYPNSAGGISSHTEDMAISVPGSTPTATPKPTPRPTGTAGPTGTPRPAGTPRPVATPHPTVKPTADPTAPVTPVSASLTAGSSAQTSLQPTIYPSDEVPSAPDDTSAPAASTPVETSVRASAMPGASMGGETLNEQPAAITSAAVTSAVLIAGALVLLLFMLLRRRRARE